jgi:hypothetical protein
LANLKGCGRRLRSYEAQTSASKKATSNHNDRGQFLCGVCAVVSRLIWIKVSPKASLRIDQRALGEGLMRVLKIFFFWFFVAIMVDAPFLIFAPLVKVPSGFDGLFALFAVYSCNNCHQEENKRRFFE